MVRWAATDYIARNHYDSHIGNAKSVDTEQEGIVSTKEGIVSTKPADNTAGTEVIDPASIPPGTAIPGGNRGNIPTCSDKIAGWNALGLQGGALVRVFEPLFVESITIGRCFPHTYTLTNP